MPTPPPRDPAVAFPSLPPERATVTGLVLAGGRGSRMGGADKGLVPWQGRPLVEHALQRLGPQVASVMLNANRNAARYAEWGLPVWPDAVPEQPGPLAGLLAGLQHCPTDWLVTVPCDSPLLPLNLVERLAAAARDADQPIAMAATREAGALRAQPVFALVNRRLAEPLALALAAGERKVDRWMQAQGLVTVPWDDVQAFANVNTPEDLQGLHRAG